MINRRNKEDALLVSKADLDPGKYERYMQGLRDQQNLGAGLLGGIVAAAAGAALWAGVTYLSNYKLGALAIVLGLLVGFAVQKVGRGIDIQFRILGAVLALVCCLAGDVLAACAFLAKQQAMSFFGVLSQLHTEHILNFVKATTKEGDIIFYAIAAYEGYKLSAKKLTQADYAKISQMP